MYKTYLTQVPIAVCLFIKETNQLTISSESEMAYLQTQSEFNNILAQVERRQAINYAQVSIQEIGVDGVTKEDDMGMAAEEYTYSNDMCTRSTTLSFFMGDQMSNIDLHEHLTDASCCYWGK